MTKEELQDLYREWSDEKLLDAYQKKKDYTEIAISAMQSILTERKISSGSETLLDEALKQETANEIETKNTFEQKQRMYEYDVLGEIISAADFAKKNKNEHGEYFSSDLVSNSYKVLRMFLFVFALVGFILTLVAIFTDAPVDNVYLYFGLPSVIFLLIGLNLFKKSKAHFKLYQEGRKNIFYLKHDKYVFQGTVPFNYSFFWTKITLKRGLIKISHPMLSLVITNQSRESILLQSNLTALQDAPPEWPENDNSCVPVGTKFFSESVYKRIELLQLKKILDGLHDIYSEQHGKENLKSHS